MVSKEDLAAIPMFAQLTESECEKLASITDKKKYSKDNIIIEENSAGGLLFIVQKGEVRIARLIRDNKGQGLVTLRDSDFFGGISFIDGKKYSASAICVADTVVLQINKDDFDELTIKYPTLGIKILNPISIVNCSHLRSINVRIQDMVKYVAQR